MSISPALSQLLNAAGLKFKITEDNSVKMGFELESGRTQMIFIDGAPDQLGPYQDHDIYSPICEAAKLSPSHAIKLMEISGTNKVGACIIRDGHLMLKTDVPVTITADQLRVVLQVMVDQADKLEQVLTGGADAF